MGGFVGDMLFANDFFIPRGGLMAGYSYFDYDQMTLLGIEVHSDELELLQQTAKEYDCEDKVSTDESAD